MLTNFSIETKTQKKKLDKNPGANCHESPEENLARSTQSGRRSIQIFQSREYGDDDNDVTNLPFVIAISPRITIED